VIAPATRIEQARWWALSQQPFYGSLTMHLLDVIDPSVQTACVNGKVIRWNPDFVAKLTDEELRFVLIHETMHCAHAHLWRLPADEAGNEAGDHAINLTLQNVPGLKMPEGGLADPAFAGLAEEEIYDRLKPAPQPPQDEQDDEQEQDGDDDSGDGAGASEGSPEGDDEGGQGDGPGNPCGEFSEPATPDNSAAGDAQASQELRETWEKAVLQSAQVAQALGKGDLPGDLQRELDRLRATKIDWRRELADFVRERVSARNDWSRPARRHAWQRVIYPKRRQDDIGLIVAARDTSGSIGNATVSAFNDLLAQCAAETGADLLILDCDAQVQAEYRVAQGEPLPERAQGGGGTDFRPVFERVRELADEGEKIAGVIYLTDLMGTEPDSVDHPTLWLSTMDATARTGRTVRIME